MDVYKSENGIQATSCREIVDIEGENRCIMRSSRVRRCQWLRSFGSNLYEVLLRTKLSVLFPLVPLAILANTFNFGEGWVFAISLLALAPLAERLGYLTEQMAIYTGDTVGGLLNATCGNATEMMIAIVALYHGKNNVVKYSLLGSVLSNLLCVLGTSLFLGGLVNMNKLQKFDKHASGVNVSLLVLFCICISVPETMMHSVTHKDVAISVLQLSRATSVIMLMAYIGYLVFQLGTHREMYEQPQDELEEPPTLGLSSSILWVCIITGFIAVLSQYVVDTIEEVAESLDMSVNFISMIALPIVGNAAEHAGSVVFALKNKLDLSLAIALGSATQIALFLVPLTVVVSWGMGGNMDLQFGLVGTVVVVGAMTVTGNVVGDGSSNYMKGLVLMLCYCVIAVCFFTLRTPITHEHARHHHKHQVRINSSPAFLHREE